MDYKSVGMPQQDAKQIRPPVLEAIKFEFRENTTSQAQIIYEIEERLHSVLNKRGDGEKGNSERPIENPSGDFSSEMGNMLSDQRSITRRLSAILSHLNEII